MFWNMSRGWKLGALTNSLHSWLAGAQVQTAQVGLLWLMYLCVYVIYKELVLHNELWDALRLRMKGGMSATRELRSMRQTEFCEC